MLNWHQARLKNNNAVPNRYEFSLKDKEGELKENMVCKDFLHTTQHGAISGKTQTKKTNPASSRLKSLNKRRRAKPKRRKSRNR